MPRSDNKKREAVKGKSKQNRGNDYEYQTMGYLYTHFNEHVVSDSMR